MSDPKYGEPVEEHVTADDATSTDDAVASAHEGLADAEAASREVVVEEPVVASEPVVAEQTETVVVEPVAEIVVAPAVDSTSADRYADEPVDETYTPGAYSGDLDAPTEVVAPAVVAPAVVAPAAPQPIFVQAPEAPRPRGNRAAAGAIGLLAAVSFGILYLAAALGLRAVDGDVTGSNIGNEATSALASWWFWVPVVVFYVAFWLLGAIINRGRWGHWVIFGLLVGLATYGGHILGQLFQAPFWQLTASQGEELVKGQVLAPLAIVAFVVGRELTIWFGAWVAARGRRVSEINREAQREYERTLEAGPRLHQG
jgi:hypothetical protein